MLIALALGMSAAVGARVGGQGATAEVLQARHYFFADAKADSPYTLFVSTKYRPGVAAPLIVALHGNGANPDEIMYVRGLTQFAGDRGYIVVAPMGFNPYAGYGSRGPGRAANRPDDPENAGALSEIDVLNVINLVEHDFTIDNHRVYLLGHSMGGAGALYLGTKYPERWAGMALFAPGTRGTDTAAAGIAALKTIPMIVFQGKDDTQVLAGNTRRFVAALKRSSVALEYHEMVGDHMSIIGWTPQNIARAFDFLEAHTKQQAVRQ